ncbi:MAG: hypothetical protein HY701_03305 [Gemmatimonadetes bacterium]|nr:hypothetical protein [Gemmatimonadota bacterium]
MRRSLVIALTCVMAAPALASAQFLTALDNLNVRVSPYLGYAIPYTASFRQTLQVEGEVITSDMQTKVAGGVAIGATAELPIGGPWSLNAAFTRTSYPTSQTRLSDGVGLAEREGGTTLTVTRGGVSFRLPPEDPLMLLHPAQASVSLGAAWVLQGFPVDRTNPELTDFLSHWAITAGAEGQARLDEAGRFGAFFAIEDNLVFWNGGEFARRANIGYGEELGFPTLTARDYDLTHLIYVRAGIAVTF